VAAAHLGHDIDRGSNKLIEHKFDALGLLKRALVSSMYHHKNFSTHAKCPYYYMIYSKATSRLTWSPEMIRRNPKLMRSSARDAWIRSQLHMHRVKEKRAGARGKAPTRNQWALAEIFDVP
jgi:hypothetical protein